MAIQFSQNSTFQGLNTLPIGIPVAGPVIVSGKITLPTIPDGDPATSQVVVTVSQTPSGGSPTVIFTGLPGARGFSLTANCAALDTISVALSSALAIDQALNVVRCTVSVG